MIIDTHVHPHLQKQMGESFLKEFVYSAPCWWEPSKKWKTDYLGMDYLGVSKLIKEMDAAHVDKAVLLGSAMLNYKTYTPPEFLADLVDKYPDRFIGFCAVDPVGDVEGVKALDNTIKNYGLKGLKVYPGYTGVKANDPKFMSLYKRAEELNIPVTIHMGFCGHHVGMLEYQRPTLLDEVADLFPNLKIVVAHMGWQWANETIFLMLRRRNIYADLASYHAFVPFLQFANTLTWVKKVGLMNRVLWGTDYPMHGQTKDLAVYDRLPGYTERHEMDPVITEADLKLIRGENAARLLGL